MTGSNGGDIRPEEFGEASAGHFTPAEARLGAVIMHDSPAFIATAIEATMVAHGLDPARRLARLRPRFEEDDVRLQDVVYFIERYGHEYVSVVLPNTMKQRQTPRHDIEAACRTAGCTLWWLTT